MKLIIDVDEKLVCEGFIRTLTEEERDILIRAIGNGVKYVEPKKGEWILVKTNYDDGGNNLYECTHCHHSDTHSGSIEVPYCWYCGADMQEIDNET